MNTFNRFAILAAALAVAACDSDGSTPPAPPQPVSTFGLQVVHASPNAPAVNVTINGDEFSGVDYKSGSPILTRETTVDYDIAVDALLPGDETATVIDLEDLSFDADIINVVFAVGNVGAEGDTAFRELVVSRPRVTVGADTVRAQVLHASPGTGPVDVYVVAPGTDITNETPLNETLGLGPVSFGGFTPDPVEIAPGEYQIIVTPAGTKDVAFDTGALSLAGGTDAVIAAVDNTNTNQVALSTNPAIPVSALLVTAAGVSEVIDTRSTAELRVTHAVPDVPGPVDVLVNGAAAIPNFEFTQSVNQIPLAADFYNFQVAFMGNVVINPDGDEIPLDAGVFYDAIAVGSIATDNLGLFTAADDARRLATAAKLRVIHGSPNTPNVDLYILPGTDNDITDDEPFAADIPYLFNSGYLQVAAGTYNIYVTPTGTKDIAIPAEGIEVVATGVYTAIARDADTSAEETGPGLILLDDFVSP